MRLILHGVIYLMSALAVLHAQGRAEPHGKIHALLHGRFDAAVRSALPNAQLESLPLPDGRDYDYLRWRVGEGQRDVTVYVMHTAKEAREGLFTMRSSLAVQTDVLGGVGDEAVLISPNAQGHQRVLFRRGRIVVLVGAPFTQDAAGFAKLFDTQVQRAMRADIPEQ